jgi:hypothetical protein
MNYLDMHPLFRTCRMMVIVAMMVFLLPENAIAQSKDNGQEAQAGVEDAGQGARERQGARGKGQEASERQGDRGKGRAAMVEERAPSGGVRLGLRSENITPDIHGWNKIIASKFSPKAKQRANPTTMIIVGFFMAFFWMLLFIGALISSAVTGGWGLALLAVLLFPTLITGIVLLIIGLAYV